MDRWRSLSVLLFKKKKKKTDIETITSCCNFFQTSGLNFKSVLNFIYTRVLFYSGPKFFKCQMIAIEKSSPSCVVFFLSSSELCFVHVFRCHFIWDVVFIYRAKHFFFVIIFLMSRIHDLVLLFLFVSMSVSVTFPSQAKG